MIFLKGYIMSKKLLNCAFLLEILAGILMFVVNQNYILSSLFIVSGILLLIAGNLLNKKAMSFS